MAPSSKDAENIAVHEQPAAPRPETKTAEEPAIVLAQPTEEKVEIPSVQHELKSEQADPQAASAIASTSEIPQDQLPSEQDAPAAPDATELNQNIEAEDVSWLIHFARN
jgi:hypothetical protein